MKAKTITVTSHPGQFPMFVRLVHPRTGDTTALRKSGNMYFRDAGLWSVSVRMKVWNKEMSVVGRGRMFHANGYPVKKTTGAFWAKDNGVDWKQYKKVQRLEKEEKQLEQRLNQIQDSDLIF